MTPTPPASRSAPTSLRPGYVVIAIAMIVLLVLHQDYWLWNNGRLVFGFVPAGLAWHMMLSLLAAGMWWLATVIAWPLDEPDALSGTGVTSARDAQAAKDPSETGGTAE